jgi:hypothetical protein
MSMAGIPPAAVQTAAGQGQSPAATQQMLASLLGGSTQTPPMQHNAVPPPQQYRPQGAQSPWWNASARQLTFNPQEGRTTAALPGGLGKGGTPQPGTRPPVDYGYGIPGPPLEYTDKSGGGVAPGSRAGLPVITNAHQVNGLWTTNPVSEGRGARSQHPGALIGITPEGAPVYGQSSTTPFTAKPKV